jgi:hypothetical protein
MRFNDPLPPWQPLSPLFAALDAGRDNAASLLDHLNKRPPCGPLRGLSAPERGRSPWCDRRQGKKRDQKFAHVIEIEAVVENDGRAILGC